jgi:hypothetical protein
MLVKFRRPGRKFRYALEHWLEANGRYRVACSHWTSLSPTVNLHLCGPLNGPWRAPAFARLFGVRYLVVGRENKDDFVGEKSKLREQYRYLGRVGRLAVLEDLEAAMLHEVPGRRVLVIATPAQWYWLTKSWVGRNNKRITSPKTPWPLLAPAEALQDEALLGAVDAVLYLDDENLERDRPVLEKIAASPTPLAVGRPIDGIGNSVVFDLKSRSWDKIIGRGGRDPVGAKIERQDQGDDPERLRFRVQAPAPAMLVMSNQHFEGWHAYLDGKPLTVLSGGPDLATVVVPKGGHDLELSYEQSSMEVATFWISSLGWIAAIGFGLFVVGRKGWAFIQRRRKKKASPDTAQ